jgi:hypothetical protein
VKDLRHVERGRDVDLLEVSVVSYERGKTQGSLQVQANKNGILSGLRKVVVPEAL